MLISRDLKKIHLELSELERALDVCHELFYGASRDQSLGALAVLRAHKLFKERVENFCQTLQLSKDAFVSINSDPHLSARLGEFAHPHFVVSERDLVLFKQCLSQMQTRLPPLRRKWLLLSLGSFFKTYRNLLAILSLVVLLGATYLYLKAQRERVWLARYYGDKAKTQVLAQELVSKIYFFWDGFSPAKGVPGSQFSASYETCFSNKEKVSLKISLGSDDGSRLFIDGRLVIDNYQTQAHLEKSAEINLEPGVHPFVVDYFQGSGPSSLSLKVETSPSGGESFKNYLQAGHLEANGNFSCEPLEISP